MISRSNHCLIGESNRPTRMRFRPARVRAPPGRPCCDAWLVWVGVDVGGKRKGFDVAVIDDRQVLALQGHLTCRQVVADIVNEHRPADRGDRQPSAAYAPDGQTARDSELQLARAICGIRWTPDARRVHASAYYAWILEGLDLFDALADRDAEVIEVFPTASWTRWHGRRGAQHPHGLESRGIGSARPGERARAHQPRPARCYCRGDDRSSAQPGADGNHGRNRRPGRPLVTRTIQTLDI